MSRACYTKGNRRLELLARSSMAEMLRTLECCLGTNHPKFEILRKTILDKFNSIGREIKKEGANANN